ncbi:putative E3 ubiquitin-protein ligase LIN-1 isoform X2 [Carica papaya]|uniref:putative E3 ubiquitin-protein ligase LIN-1 isoform X2 n=1 Tax=Carica papaya TaxID=3649 RepID=UPI000B8CAD86|nr:putative E3 ubiquitin-protein ligase LIN-1 isoform X2 [Carica papaya]
MASMSPFPALASFHDHEKPDLNSIQELVISVNKYIVELLANTEIWNSLRIRCTSRLHIEKQEFFEFSEHSVISNLYWGIDSIENAIRAKFSEERTCRLQNSERMLQVPALLDEHGVTAGIPNHYLVASSYFYLSMVRKLQGDQWQAALHFVQAFLVSPRFVQTEIALELCQSLFPSCSTSETHSKETGRRSESVLSKDFNDSNCEAARQIARRYKYYLTYYQVMSYGETTQQFNGSEDVPLFDIKSQNYGDGTSSAAESSKLDEHATKSQTYCTKKAMQFEKVHPVDFQENKTDRVTEVPKTNGKIPEIQDYSQHLNQIPKLKLRKAKLNTNLTIRCLQDILGEYQSDSPTSVDSHYNDSGEDDFMENMDAVKSSGRAASTNAGDLQPGICHQKLAAPCSTSGREGTGKNLLQAPEHLMHKEDELYTKKSFSGISLNSISDLNLSIMELQGKDSNSFPDAYEEDAANQMILEMHKVQGLEHITSTSLKSCRFTQRDNRMSATRKMWNSHSQKRSNDVCIWSAKDPKSELLAKLEDAISKLCFSKILHKHDEDYAVEATTICEMLNSKTGLKYTMLKDVILDQLLAAITTSKEETAIRASVSILTTIISANKSVIEDIKKKGLQLSDLASALKQNVHEAATLIYLIKPSPTEIKSLELLPALVEVVCTSKTYKCRPTSLLLTPPGASLMIIEVLITAFDYDTNKTHLAAINSPRVLNGLLEVAKDRNLKEFISLATVLIKCMQFDGQSRKYISQITPVAPFISLLQSNEKRANFVALEFFHEILRMPRSSAISLLQQIWKEGSIHLMQTLILCVQQLQSDYQLFAANLLLQLDALDNSSGKSMFKEEAMKAILKSMAEEGSSNQLLALFILSNIGGTYTWTGEPYTVAWLVKKAGLTSLHHRNMIRDFDWLDQSLQDAGLDAWCSKISRSIIDMGKSVFDALEKGIKSKIKRVSRESLTTIAWLGFEITKCSNAVKNLACEILLGGTEQYLHPGFELEERFLACLCIYNYASGKGMKKLIHFSEGVRESLRRFSNVTWMAEELHQVADYYLPNKSRISCVHTQTAEMRQSSSGAVSALIYYKGLLYSGYSDGSIKVWNIQMQSATLVWETNEHKKAVTCFSLFEPGERLLSGSADKTIRVWQMIKGKLECIEVIAMKEPIRKLDTYGKIIFAITQGHKMKLIDSSRMVKSICKGKSVSCMTVVQGKIYMGCTDSSIKELNITNNREREIKGPASIWRIQNKPISTILMYRDWLYNSSSAVEVSNIKEWRKHCEPQMSIAAEKGAKILAMAVVEDFIYLNRSSSTSTLQKHFL